MAATAGCATMVAAAFSVTGVHASTAGTLATVAGGPGVGAPLTLGQAPNGVAVAGGTLYVADGTRNVVRRIQGDPPNEDVVAGNATPGFSGEGTPATAASLNYPEAVAVDPAGDVFFSDFSNNRLRVVAAVTGPLYGVPVTAGDIYTLAGGALAGYAGDGGPATAATLNSPTGVTVDPEGNLIVADTYNQRIRVIAGSSGTFYGVAMTANDIYTVAGNGVRGLAGDLGPATAAKLNFPYGVSTDSAGNLLIADTFNNQIRVVPNTTGTYYGVAMTAGDIYRVAGRGGHPGSIGDGGPALLARLHDPAGATVDPAGNLVIADTNNSRIQIVAESTATFYGQAMTAGDMYTIAGTGSAGFAGDGGPAASAQLSFPQGVAVDGAGDVVIADAFNNRVRVIAAATGTVYGVAMTADDIDTVAGNGTQGYSGDGGPATVAELDTAYGVAFDHSGNLLVVDTGNDRVRVVAGSTGTFYGQAMTAGDIYTVAGTGDFGFSGDGGPATAADMLPSAITVDPAGNLVIADGGNERVRVVAIATGVFYGQAMSAGDIYTVAGDGTSGYLGDGGPATAAELTFPDGVAVDAGGNLVVADTDNEVVRVVASATGVFYGQAMTAGDIYTIAGNGTFGSTGDGGPATAAELKFPDGLAIDGSGNVLLADSGNHRIRVVAVATGTFYQQAMTAGDIYTIAGTGKRGFSGNRSLATAAKLAVPNGVVLDSSGNVVVADSANNQIRVVAEHTGTFFGVAMKTGNIYPVAGSSNKPGFAGDGGAGTSGKLDYPYGEAVDASGDLFFADLLNSRVRELAGP